MAMHRRNMPFRSLTVRSLVGLVALSFAVVATACASPVPAATPSPTPTPLVTPNPHLPDPTTADDVFLAIGGQGLRLLANNATTGTGGLVKRINASFGGWPLTISEYVSAAELTRRLDWPIDEQPGGNESAVAMAGQNILVTWGPISNGPPEAPDPARAARLVTLAQALDVLLGPVRVRSIVPLAVTTPAPDAPASTDPSPEPEATPGS